MRLIYTFACVVGVAVLLCLGAAHPGAWDDRWLDVEGLSPEYSRRVVGQLGQIMAAKRCAWETRNDICGVSLSDPAELSLVTGATCSGMVSIPAAQINETSEGLAFVTQTRLQELSTIRTSRPCALILKGFISQKIVSLGIASNRMHQIVLTLWDGVASLVEARAVTLVNLAVDEMDFINKTHSDDELALRDESKLPILFEMRKTEAAASDWKAYGTVAAFNVYIESLLKSLGLLSQSILHKTIEKQDYFVRRVQIPSDARDSVYRRSGACSVQCRAGSGPTGSTRSGLRGNESAW